MPTAGPEPSGSATLYVPALSLVREYALELHVVVTDTGLQLAAYAGAATDATTAGTLHAMPLAIERRDTARADVEPSDMLC